MENDLDEYIITADEHTISKEYALWEWFDQLPRLLHMSRNGVKEDINPRSIDDGIIITVLRDHFDELMNLVLFLMFKTKHGNEIQNNGSKIVRDYDRIGNKYISVDVMAEAGILNELGNTNFNINENIVEKVKRLIEYVKKG